ncbi:hypothetical protein PRNP1_007989 [Phytophthora ramorum]
MKLRFFLALLLVIDFSNSLAHAESTVEETDSIRPVLRVHRGLQGSQTRNEGAEDINTGDEERAFNIPGFSKLKSLFQKSGGLANKAGALQKDPKLVNSLQKNSEVMKIVEPLKSQPKVLNTLKSLQKNPKAVEALQKAPATEANFNKLKTAITKGKKQGYYEPTGLFYLCGALLILGVGGLLALLTIPK